jgi:hypothetical protein
MICLSYVIQFCDVVAAFNTPFVFMCPRFTVFCHVLTLKLVTQNLPTEFSVY